MLIKITKNALFVFLCIASIIYSNVAQANTAQLNVTGLTRITPLEVYAGNIFNGVMQPWNKNFTKVLIFEDDGGGGGITPRGLVWGLVSSLKNVSGGTYAQYAAVTTKVPANWRRWVEWSTLTAEDDILYGMNESTHILQKYNTTTGVVTDVTSYTKTGVDVTYARIWGTTQDGNIIIVFGDGKMSNPYERWTYGGWEINLATGNKTFRSNYPQIGSVEMERWPWFSHGHTHLSPNRKAIAYYSSSAYMGNNIDYDGVHYPIYDTCPNGTCPEAHHDTSSGYPDNWTGHASWWADDNWYLAYDAGLFTSGSHAPGIRDQKIWQVVYNRTTNTFTRYELLSMRGATYWIDGSGNDINYGAIPHGIDRKDGKSVYFFSNGGDYYTYADYQKTGKTPWRNVGAWIADLAPASGAQTCTSFTYAAWGECQPNNTQTRILTSSSPSGCTGGNPVLSQSCTYNAGTIQNSLLKAASSPVIDGNLGEYASANPISFSPSSGGNNVTVRTLWDSEALYFGIDVTDTQLNASVSTRDGSVWSEDSIEWFIDTYNDGGGSLNPDAAYMRPDDYQGIVNIINTKYDSQGTTSGTPSGSWNGTWQSAVKLSGTNNNNADTDNGYTVEIKIPWTSIGYLTAPSADTIIGISFAVDDKDSNGTYSKMWLSDAGANQNASNWQKVLLSGSTLIVDTIAPAPPTLSPF